MKRLYGRRGGKAAVRKVLTALTAAILLLSALSGCGRRGPFKMEKYMTYTEAERALIDEYLSSLLSLFICRLNYGADLRIGELCPLDIIEAYDPELLRYLVL